MRIVRACKIHQRSKCTRFCELLSLFKECVSTLVSAASAYRVVVEKHCTVIKSGSLSLEEIPLCLRDSQDRTPEQVSPQRRLIDHGTVTAAARVRRATINEKLFSSLV